MKKVLLYIEDDVYKTVMLPDEMYERPECIIVDGLFFFKTSSVNLKQDAWVYRKGIAITGVKEFVDPEKMTAPVKNHKTDEEILFGQPYTLEEAAEDFLSFFSKAKDFDCINTMTEFDFVLNCHHGSGQWMRSGYFLWWQHGHNYEGKWPSVKPKLVSYFNDLGVTHADDMSSMILKAAYRLHHKVPVLEHELVAKCKSFWKQNGYSDGIYKIR